MTDNDIKGNVLALQEAFERDDKKEGRRIVLSLAAQLLVDINRSANALESIALTLSAMQQRQMQG